VQHLGDLVAGEAVDQLVELLGAEIPATRHHRVDAATVHLLEFLLSLFGCARGGDVDRSDDVGLGVLLTGLVRAPVGVHGLLQVSGGEVAGEGVRQAELCSERRAEEGGPEDNDRDVRAGAGHRVHAGQEGLVGKVAAQLLHILGEAIGGTGDAPDSA